MRGKPIKVEQIQVYMRARTKDLTQSQASEIAGFSDRSGRRIESERHQPGREKPPGRKPDPLAEVWERVLQPKLEADPRLKPRTLYEFLLEQYPQQYEGVLRPLQRRVQEWKAAHGRAKEVMFAQEHPPGRMGLSDFTHLKAVTVTIGGKPFHHLLYHYRLAYSGWRSVSIIQGGESFIGLSSGLQKALWDCGDVPQLHRTDSLSAAYRNLGDRQKSPLTRIYEGLCNHYRVEPTHNNKGVAHENGSIESPHGHFKRRLSQALYLRASCDFESVSAYQQFIDQEVAKLNARCQVKFALEQQHLQALPQYRYADYEELTVRVTCFSSINVRAVIYSVPSRLIGVKLTLHLYPDRLVGFLGSQPVLTLERVHVPGGNAIRRVMVAAIYIAAVQDQESAVASDLDEQLRHNTLTLVRWQQHFEIATTPTPIVRVQQHDLTSYDQFLSFDPPPAPPTPPGSSESLRQPDLPAQESQTASYAGALATTGTTSHPGTLVLPAVLAGFMRTGSPKALYPESPTGDERGSTPDWKKFNQLRL